MKSVNNSMLQYNSKSQILIHINRLNNSLIVRLWFLFVIYGQVLLFNVENDILLDIIFLFLFVTESPKR